jgi:branched-chain amino acid aminotransferase
MFLFFSGVCSMHAGVTRQVIIELMPSLGLPPVVEKRISLTEAYTSDEVFTTGTMGELTPVREIDGRIIGDDDDDYI